ncbi:hypothetical protein CHS0354_028642 [Potamilus streckersoni]|uniref:PLAT domain-containing protein n=1 Tax=Potamilus streckersoni TaxID=2493646 RepID=A0AAE0SW95_9BIVA|nr:hypothetical protein CHS0354_028642 [Potamilus streckersoni]
MYHSLTCFRKKHIHDFVRRLAGISQSVAMPWFVWGVFYFTLYFPSAVSLPTLLYGPSVEVTGTGVNCGVSILPSFKSGITSGVACCALMSDVQGMCWTIPIPTSPEKVYHNLSDAGYRNISVFCFANISAAESYEQVVYVGINITNVDVTGGTGYSILPVQSPSSDTPFLVNIGQGTNLTIYISVNGGPNISMAGVNGSNVVTIPSNQLSTLGYYLLDIIITNPFGSVKVQEILAVQQAITGMQIVSGYVGPMMYLEVNKNFTLSLAFQTGSDINITLTIVDINANVTTLFDANHCPGICLKTNVSYTFNDARQYTVTIGASNYINMGSPNRSDALALRVVYSINNIATSINNTLIYYTAPLIYTIAIGDIALVPMGIITCNVVFGDDNSATTVFDLNVFDLSNITVDGISGSSKLVSKTHQYTQGNYYTIRSNCSNSFSALDTQELLVTVENPVNGFVKLVNSSNSIPFTNPLIELTVAPTSLTDPPIYNLGCQIDFGEGDPVTVLGNVTSTSVIKANFSYSKFKVYNIKANCSNHFDAALMEIAVEVYWNCFKTFTFFDEAFKSSLTPLWTYVTDPFKVTGTLQRTSSCLNTTSDYFWNIYKDNILYKSQTLFPTTSSVLSFAPEYMEPGIYKVTLNCSFNITDGTWREDFIFLEFRMPNVKAIVATQELVIPYIDSDLPYTFVLDGTGSGDLVTKLPSVVSIPLNYSWTCKVYLRNDIDLAVRTFLMNYAQIQNDTSLGSSESCGFNIPETQVVELPNKLLTKSDKWYLFVLTVRRGSRNASAVQAVKPIPGDPIMVITKCIYNCNTKLMHAALSLEMDVAGKDTMNNLTGQGAKFEWEIVKWSAANMMFVPASTIVTERGTQSRGITILKGSFELGSKYQIAAKMVVGNRRGSSFTLRISNLPPYDGSCTIDKYKVSATIDPISFTCSGWLDDGENEVRSPTADVNPKISYQLIQFVSGGEERVLLNTANSYGTTVLSLGDPARDYTTTVAIRVVDITGDYAEQTFEVQSRPFEAFSSLSLSSSNTTSQNDTAVAAAIDQFTSKFTSILQEFPAGSNPDDIIGLVVSGASQMDIVEIPASISIDDLKAETPADAAVNLLLSDEVPAATSKAQDFTATLVNVVLQSALPQNSSTIEPSRISQVSNTLSVIINDPNKVNDKTKELVLGALDQISTGMSTKSLDNEESKTAVNSTFKLIATASGAISPAEKRTTQEPNFDELRLQNKVLDQMNGKQYSDNSSRSPDEEAFLTYLQQLKESYKLGQESGKMEHLQNIIDSTIQNIKDNQPLSLDGTQSYGGSDFQQSISLQAASEIQGKSLKSMTSSVVIDRFDVPVTGNIKMSLSSMAPGRSAYKFDKDGESRFLSSETSTFNFGINFTGVLTTKQTVQTPELVRFFPAMNSDDASRFSYHKFFIRSKKDNACMILKPADSRIYQYQVYIKKNSNPTLVDYDVKTVCNEANGWKACVDPGQLDNHEGLTYLGLRSEFLPTTESNNEDKTVNRIKREAVNNTASSNKSTCINPGNPESCAYEFGTITLSCLVWLKEEQRWTRNGCDMTWRPDQNAVYCKCKAKGTELTFGNSFYVAPNAIDFSAVFLKFDALSQAAVMATLIIIFIGYIGLVIWARRQDRKDVLKWGVTPLADNFPDDNYFYLLRVYTGARPGSGTRSKVGFVLSGANADTGVRELYDGVRNEFQTGAVFNFLLSTSFHLGQLNYLRIWHDNSGGGSHASWYLDRISVHDIQRKETFDFVVERWLAAEYGELDCIIPTCNEESMKQFKHRMNQNFKDCLSNDHMWISIFYRPQVSSFNRVQRVTCALTFLMLSMLSNAMYFNPNPNYESTTGVTMGPFRFTFQQLYVSTISSLIPTSVMIVVVIMFKKSRRRSKKKASNLKPKSSFTSCYKLRIMDKWLDLKRKESVELEKHVIVKGHPTFTGCHLPFWVLNIAWFLNTVSVLLSAFFVILYSMQWGKQKSEEWLLSFILSFLESAIFIDPFKVFFLSAAFSLLFNISKEEDLTLDRVTIMRQYQGSVRGTAALTRKPAPPLSRSALLEAKKRREIDLKAKGVVNDIVVNLIYVWILLTIGYSNRDDRSYMLHETITSTFLHPRDNIAFDMITSTTEYFQWLNGTAFNNLFPVREYNNMSLLWRRKEFVSGFSLFRLGPPRLRQVRTTKGNCYLPYFGYNVCYPAYETTKEDSNSYCVGWKTKPCPANQKLKKMSSNAWTFTDPKTIWGISISGEYTMYSGGGYIANMAVNKDITIWILNELWAESWIDRQTRAVMLEFTLYCVDINLFIYNMFVVEMPETGGVNPFYIIQPMRLYMHNGPLGMYTMTCEVIFLLFVFGNTVLIILKLRKQKRSYFRDTWQVIDILAVIGCYVAIVLYFIRFKLAMDTIARFNDDKKKFVNFQHIAIWDEAVVLIIGLLIFVATIRFLKIIGFSKRVHALVNVFKYAGEDLISFGAIFVTFLVVYAAFGYLLFGSKLELYRSFHEALSTLFISMIGKSIYTEMNMTDPIMAKIYFMLFVLVIVYTLLTIFLSLLDDSIGKANEDIKNDDNEVIVDALTNMFRGFVGLNGETKNDTVKAEEKYIVQPDAETTKVTPTPSVTSHNEIYEIIMEIRQSFQPAVDLILAGRRQTKNQKMKQMRSTWQSFILKQQEIH